MNAPRENGRAWPFVTFMTVLILLFIGLGFWQMARLEQKETMIARVHERLELPARALPPASEWVGFDGEWWDFRPTTTTGKFLHDQTIMVFTSLAKPNGRFLGTGYWVVAPFQTSDGGIIFVNRGFIPEGLRGEFANGGPAEAGEVTITGLSRRSERTNNFTPGADRINRVEWVRNIERLKAMSDIGDGPLAPVYFDQLAGPPDSLPQGGETKLTVINRHFEYALTWFSLAGITPILLGFWLFSRRRK